MENIDEAWNNYLSNPESFIENICKSQENELENIPECEELYISTKTKVLFLNQPIDINNVFWKLPIIEYGTPCEGIIKKQMKVVSKTPEEYDLLRENLKKQKYYTENIIKQINNPEARRIKFKDERKITVGLSKKDIVNSRGKVKNAFYNCFAIIVRFKYQDIFREIHVKVFNTGKLEIPGILNVEILEIIQNKILNILGSILESKVHFVEQDVDHHVLINSNFNCGFFVNRDKLYDILKSKYKVETAYDPCSYPGVKCKFYYNHEFTNENQNGRIAQEDSYMKMCDLLESKKYTEVSFMIFRTGSVLIIGNCDETVLYNIYNFIKNILQNEYKNIVVLQEKSEQKQKVKKLRKKYITVT